MERSAAMGGMAAAALLSGMLLAASLPPHGLWPLAFVAFVPVLATAARIRRAFAAALLGWAAGCTAAAAATPWLPATLARLQHTTLTSALPSHLLFVAYHGLPFAAVTWLFHRICGPSCLRPANSTDPERACRGPVGTAAVIAPAWLLGERLFPVVFPWQVGDALAASPLLRQAADLGGAPLLSLAVVAVNVLLASGLTLPGQRAPRRLAAAAAAAAVVVALASYGAWRQPAVVAALAAAPTVRVAIVQAPAATDAASMEDLNEKAWRLHAAATRSAVGGATAAGHAPQLVLWPETVLRTYLRDDPRFRRRVEDLSIEIGAPILLGALDRPPSTGGEWNTAYIFRGRENPQVYYKRHLLPFGERVPAAARRLGLGGWQTTGEFVPGAAADLPVFRPAGWQRDLRLGISICFEALLLGRRYGPQGADLLVNITDDLWFGDTAQRRQHLEHVRLRAVEERRYLLRAAAAGVSAVIDATGEVVASAPVGAHAHLIADIPIAPLPSLHARWPDWPVYAAALWLATALATTPRRRCAS